MGAEGGLSPLTLTTAVCICDSCK